MSFFDNLPPRSLYIEPGEPPLHATGQMQLGVDGSRTMESSYWNVGYRVLPTGADAHGITGESFWATGAKSPMLDIELQRDGRGQVAREILRSPPAPASPEAPWRVLGWYEYVRNDQGQLRQLVYHQYRRTDGQPPSDDDPILSTVEIDYGLGGRNPQAATVILGLVRQSVRFEYDSAGRLTGGARLSNPPSRYSFSVTRGACEEVPERVFVLLLAAHGGPWRPFYAGRRGTIPAGPR